MAEIKIKAEVAGIVSRVIVKSGDRVQASDQLLVIEVMKMEIPVQIEKAGIVRSVAVQEGDMIMENQLLATIEA